MVAPLFMLSDFVVAVLIIMGGAKLAFQQSEMRAAIFIPGMGLVLLGVLGLVFSRKAMNKVRWLYLPRVLVYLALFVLLTGAFLQNWFHKNGAVERGDWQLFVLGGIFLFSNVVGYAVWARQGQR
jgi:hypothetical protein